MLVGIGARAAVATLAATTGAGLATGAASADCEAVAAFAAGETTGAAGAGGADCEAGGAVSAVAAPTTAVFSKG